MVEQVAGTSVVRLEGFRHRLNAGKSVLLEQVPFFRRQFGEVSSSWKPDQSRVTFPDFAISERILSALAKNFVKDDFCSEESDPADEIRSLGAEFAWVLDPIDGTNNYALALPNTAISLALLRHGVPVYGWVYDYAGDQLIHGGRGVGLFNGSRKIGPLEENFNEESIIGLQFPLPPERVTAFSSLFGRFRIRSLGSGTMLAVYVALGRFSGAMDFRVKVWDIAAAYALCQASGRLMEFPFGSPFPLRTFHPESGTVPYLSGCEEFRERMRPLFSQGS